MSVYYFFDSESGLPFRYLTPTRWTSELPPPYDTTMLPQHYLEFATNDLQDTTPRGRVNAFGNAKRALHFMIDSLLHQYGLFTHYKRSNFPTKLRLLDEIGILPITLMRNLNVERNLLEHEYAVPSRKRVEEAVDVAALILLATEKLSERIPNEMVVGWRSPSRHSVMRVDPFRGEITLHTLRAPGKYRRSKGISYFSGSLRNFLGSQLSEGITIAKTPWKTIKLNRQSQSEWQPILSLFVSNQRKGRLHTTSVNAEAQELTMAVTIPLPNIPGKTWSEFLDEFVSKQADEIDSAGQSEQGNGGNEEAQLSAAGDADKPRA